MINKFVFYLLTLFMFFQFTFLISNECQEEEVKRIDNIIYSCNIVSNSILKLAKQKSLRNSYRDVQDFCEKDSDCDIEEMSIKPIFSKCDKGKTIYTCRYLVKGTIKINKDKIFLDPFNFGLKFEYGKIGENILPLKGAGISLGTDYFLRFLNTYNIFITNVTVTEYKIKIDNSDDTSNNIKYSYSYNTINFSLYTKLLRIGRPAINLELYIEPEYFIGKIRNININDDTKQKSDIQLPLHYKKGFKIRSGVKLKLVWFYLKLDYMFLDRIEGYSKKFIKSEGINFELGGTIPIGIDTKQLYKSYRNNQ